MKTRLGFVSNSSSSSFLIYGVALDHEQLMNFLRSQGNEFSRYKGEKVTLEDMEEMQLYELTEFLDIPRDSQLDVDVPPNDLVYIGISWDSVKDNETGKQFKNRVYKELRNIGLKVEKGELSTHSEAWGDY